MNLIKRKLNIIILRPKESLRKKVERLTFLWIYNPKKRVLRTKKVFRPQQAIKDA